jgi:ElaB/YqjD/DUF883 family membrane-anchored ribosome-binding protein
MFNRIAGLTDPPHLPPLAATAKDAWQRGSKSAQTVLRQVEDLVAQHPGAALATAFAVGLAVAWWLKRR